jgi:two-component system, NtrC family, sensor kinase
MTFFANIKPKFWDHVGTGSGAGRYMFNFRRIWKLTVLATLCAALTPLSIMTLIDYRVSRDATLSEIMLRTGQLASNTKHSVSYFLTEREAALEFINQNDPLESLVTPGRLSIILQSLQKSFGGFVDLGVIDDQGVQAAYAGPFDLIGKDYSNADWFKQVNRKGIYVSDVFSGFRNVPHMVIAVKHAISAERFYVLRATLDAASINDLFSGLELGGAGDAFIINHEGVLQTPSREFGQVLEPIGLDVPEYSDRSEVKVLPSATGEVIMGYAYIPQTSFILLIIKHKEQLMAPWNHSRMQIIAFLVISSVAILLVVLGGTTFLVNQIYLADQRRLMAMHQAEYSNKMASLGRLSAGVAHEINNPLAIINEKAGLIKDLFTLTDNYSGNPKLMALINSVLSSVDRCAGITRRLLNFARRSATRVQEIDIASVISEVLDFMGKEAEYRCIAINISTDKDLPKFYSDPGKLQEILLNLFTNAFAAMNDGGKLSISAFPTDRGQIEVRVIDSGHGIPKSDIDRVFEPFFSTKIGKGGTGLGLSITYGLVQELGGDIQVQSVVGEGTTFILTLPLNPTDTARGQDESGTMGRGYEDIAG